MDRNKPVPGTRGPKAKITQQPPNHFIALGTKPTSVRDDPKRPAALPPTVSSSSKAPVVDKFKREGNSSSIGVPPAKKLKVAIAGTRPGIPGPSGSSLLPIDRLTGAPAGAEPWEALAVDCEASELFESVMGCLQNNKMDKAVGIILGVIRTVRSHRSKICKVVYSSLFLLCSCKPTLYSNEHVVAAMLSVLRRDVNTGMKGTNKTNCYVHMLLINLLTHAFSDIVNWPDQFLKLYVEDAVTDRVFIDNPYCKPFVDNIITAFNTKIPPNSLLKSESWTSSGRDTSSPVTIHSVDDDDASNEHKALVEGWNAKVHPRYAQAQENVEHTVLEVIKEQLARRQQPETATKNFIRFLSTACGLVEIRIIAVSRIETWLHNHKLMKPAQELLAYLCYNCSVSSHRDMEVMIQLSKLRLKNKPMVSYFNNCLKEMVCSFPENLYPLMKYTIYNELSNARNTNNLIVVGALFQVAPRESCDAFAEIVLELLTANKEDYLRSIRALLKEINRVLRTDFNLPMVVQSLLRERKDVTARIRDHEFRERIFCSLADLSAMCMLLCVSPQVRDAATQSKRDVSVLKTFQRQVRDIQKECVSWLQDSAVRIYRPTVTEFHHVLLKVVFLEQAEHYYKIDSWPGENERTLFLRLASEVPLHQATLIRILLIGISKEHHIAQTDIIDIVDQLIKRAANLPQDCEPPLVVDKPEIFDFFFRLCTYNYPENIVLPPRYEPPKLAISSIYWRAWFMMLIISAHNPLNFGGIAWNKYPMLRMFMEMCITNHFSFPPPTMVSLEEDYHVKEQQIVVVEKQKILEFESHLAAASTKMEITEQTSLLLSQVMELQPESEARRPPQQVLDQLQALNHSHRLGHLLCKSRHPDFLLDIMTRQGGNAHMPWLAELVHSSEGVLSHLPVQCLCEYLLSTAPTEKLTKHGQLLAHLRMVVNGPDPQIACEVLEYLFRRLTSDHSASRTQSTKALALILAPSDEEVSLDNSTNWLTKFIPQFPHFNIIKHILIQFLRQALQIETNPSRVSSYMNFLSQQDFSDSFVELNELITDLASVIIERHSVASYVLPGDNYETLKNLLRVFLLHTQKSKEYADETYNLLQSYNAEYVFINWSTGEQCAMQSVVIHSAIVLLTYGPLDDCAPFQELLNTWFPDNREYPRAFTETSEATSYVPDWMKLRMIRSTVPKLVDAAIEKLEPPKLVLFIQSFGIPTSSISKLLHTLDKATILDPKLVVDSVLDKTYMIQLVDVQNKRGATGGETFIKAIEMQMPLVPDEEIKVQIESKKLLPQVSQKKQHKTCENDVVQILNNLYNPHFTGDRNIMILSLVKAINVNKNLVDVVMSYIKSVPLTYTSGLIVQFSSFSSVVRLMFNANQEPPTQDKLVLAEQLLQVLPPKEKGGGASVSILQQFVETGVQSQVKIEVNAGAEEMIKSYDLVTSDKCAKVTESPEDLGQKLGKMLLEGGEDTVEKTGLVVDWLSTIELEIAHSNKQKLQMDLLFSKQSLPFRPLLMSLVLQRATWKSLNDIMHYLLENKVENICPTSALDFFTALTQSPKMWQGRDKSIPKHYHFEDVLKLNKDQSMVLVNYVLDEARLHPDPDKWMKFMETRLPLLLKCIKASAVGIVKYLTDLAESDLHASELLLLIYMSFPFSGQSDISETEEMSLEVFERKYPSAVDELSHSILTALACTPRTNYWTKRSQEYELCARKLVSCHPLLALRQLPMVAGSLKGRAQYDWGVLRSRGHLMFFSQVMGLMELLQPHIFQHPTVLSDLLDSYFSLLHFHGTNKDLSVLIGRLVVFMQNWLLKDIKSASKYLQEHGSVLNDIQFSQPRVRPLLSNVSLPIADQGLAPAELLVGTVTPPVAEQLPQHWPQLLTALQSPENLGALQELDHITNKRPQLLEGVTQHLYTSLMASNGPIRSLALVLIIRWLKYNPKAAVHALPSVLACLDSNNGDVVSTVLDRLSDLVTVMQEYTKVILTRVFLLGMKSTLNTTTNITKTVDLLSLQYGF